MVSVLFFKKKWAIPGLSFFIFVFSIQLTAENVGRKSLPMTGFEPWTSSVGSDHSTNRATTTALLVGGYDDMVHIMEYKPPGKSTLEMMQI